MRKIYPVEKICVSEYNENIRVTWHEGLLYKFAHQGELRRMRDRVSDQLQLRIRVHAPQGNKPPLIFMVEPVSPAWGVIGLV